jgi:acyl carrier protein
MESDIRDVLEETGRLSKPLSEIGNNDDLYDAGLSSLATVNVMLGLEEKFDVEFTDDLLARETFQSIDRLMKIIMGLRATEKAR